MIRKLLLTPVCLFMLSISTQAQDLSTLESKRMHLPNGWSLTPAGNSIPLGDLPLNIAISSTRRYAAVTNNGQSTQTIQLIDARNDTFKLEQIWPKAIISPTGIALDDKQHRLYVATKENNSLYVIDLDTKEILHQQQLSAEAYTCLLSPDKKELYISLWGGDKIVVYNTGNKTLTDSIAVGDNPNDLCITKNGQYLYVANANDNSVSVIHIKARKVKETLNAALYPTQLSGSTSNALALSDDERTLYIANADNNCLAVFDVSKAGSSVSKGFIPTGWYPTTVRVSGKKLYVANGKGFSSFPNPLGPNPYNKKEHVGIHTGDSTKPTKVQYIGGGLLTGTMSIIPVPDEKQLSVYSQAVYHNTPYNKDQEQMAGSGMAGNPVPTKVGAPSPIKHVFYIIKENRTYDQVLGDMKEGNGDTSLLLFGEKITPNQHAIARQFVLLDNFYVDGEVSADGHNWSMGAYATDYMEKNWPTSYGSRGLGAVVFILEDDAQNGPDHVDAHRSPAYVAGGYVKRNFVDHTMYTTSSVIHTIELILGMPPMTQYDAAAMPMWRSFTDQADVTPFRHLPSNVNLKEVNPSGTQLAALSKGLDFSREDVIPDQLMNMITWKAVKGENAEVPAIVRAAFVKPVKPDDDDDDDDK